MTINGYDISSWDDDQTTPQHINFDLLAENSRFCIARAGYGGWVDRDFIRSWSEMRRLNMVRGAYWYVTDQVNAKVAAQAFVSAMAGDYGTIPPSADFEMANWGLKPRIAVLREFVEEVYRLTGLRCMIYTGFYVWRDYGSADPYWKQYPLWIAAYNNTGPSIPAPWTDYKFWQYTDRSPGGPSVGVESLMLDDNKYYGTEAQFAAEFGEPPMPPGDLLTLKSVTVAGVKVPALVTVTWSTQWGDTSATIDQAPVITPPPAQNNLYRVAAELWPINHGGQSQPGDGGPLVQVVSDSMKGGKYTIPLDDNWQRYIKSFNTSATWDKIKDAHFGPSQGINSQGKLKWNYLIWPGTNVVMVLEVFNGWARIDTIPNRTGGETPETYPWLFHKVCDNRGNPVLVQGAPIICPLIAPACYVPMSALVKL